MRRDKKNINERKKKKKKKKWKKNKTEIYLLNEYFCKQLIGHVRAS